MARIEEAQSILKALGMPAAQCNRMSGLTLMALCGLLSDSPWSESKRIRCTITKGIMGHIKKHFNIEYAPNTRETFRRQVLHQFMQGRVVDYNPYAPELPTNSPRAHYAITKPALAAVRSYGTNDWEHWIKKFFGTNKALAEIYKRDRERQLIPVKLPSGQKLQLSPGKHNDLQKAVVEEFAARFAPGANLLYIGDTSDKYLMIDRQGLDEIGIRITDHDKLPDIVLHDSFGNRVFLIEAVTSHGPMSPKRVVELEAMLSNCSAVVIFVSAFLEYREFHKHLMSISWDTEVWSADRPDHLVHFNGDRFLQA